jgi:4-hydroxy-4-methyl-2-oxoglutarate aldolase
MTADSLEKLRSLDTCTVANAIETFNLRPRNEGFASAAIRCQFPHFPPMLGYAVTGRIRTSSPPMSGRLYYDQMEFWKYVLTIPKPRVIVMEDVGREPGTGALVGEIHAALALTLNCVGYVTNGSFRDMPAVEANGFHVFAAGVAVSHAYARIVEFGMAVDIGGLQILPGDLVHGDCHGIQTIPSLIAERIPEVAADLREKERKLIEYCRSADFSIDELGGRFEQMAGTLREGRKQ